MKDMEEKISSALDEYERDTYEAIRVSYEKMMKELNDAVNNVLTMTSFDFENSMKNSVLKVRNLLTPTVLERQRIVEKKIKEEEALKKDKRTRRQEQEQAWYEEILQDSGPS